LGATSFNKIHQPGDSPADDTSLQREQLANSFLRALGVPWLNRRYVVVYVNGNRRGTLMEDTQCPDGDVVKEHFPNDTDGYLYKMQPWFEFAPAYSGGTIGFVSASWCDLMPFTTTGGVKKPARYRYMFESRRTPDSASNFTNVFSLVDAAGSYGASANYVANLQNLADMENWMRVFAANHAAGNEDVFGAMNAQNLYGYIGTLGTKYSLLMWDFNEVFDHGRSTPGGDLFLTNSDDPNTAHLYNEPTFRRMYWRALQELVSGPLDLAKSGPLLDAKYNAFVANGLSVEDPAANIKPWISSAHDSIASQIAAENTTNFTVSGTVVVSNDVAYLSGTAPVAVKTIWFNGVAWPVTWTSVTNWTAVVALQQGTNVLHVAGIDIHGQPIPGYTNTATAVYNGTLPSPVGNVVINEIMSHPLVPDSEYVELYNNSSTITFDLSGWQFRGLSYTFPAGSLIGPRRFLVLAANPAAFAAAYGATVPVFDTFGGTLPTNGETLSLVTASNLVVAQVQYRNTAPWPTGAAGTGASLQLIDPLRDNWRAGNWAAVSTNGPLQPQWVYATATGTNSSSLLYLYLDAPGEAYLDDLKLVSGSVPEAGANLVADGDFESGFPGPWTVSANLSGSALSTAVMHSGSDSLHLVASSGGTSQGTAIWQTISPALTIGQTSTVSFWYLQNTNASPPNLVVRLSNSGIVANVNPALSSRTVTPANTNSVLTSLPAFPPLWLNELQADNLTGITNSAGQRVPWIELYNPTTNVVALSNLFLANNYSNLLAWPFPSNAVINPGEFKVVFADGLTNLSTTNELHAGFTLPSQNGSVALSRLYAGQPQVLDFIDYANLGFNHSYGSFPDGQSFLRQEFFYATPGGTNNGTSAPLTVRINEWMAGNTHTIPDPLDGNKYDDWFELYNYGTNTADPTGYYLTHTLTNRFEYQIPSGYAIPPHSFLLVWADKKTPTGSGDLHTNFKLTKSGTSIGLFGADGTAVDFVSFGQQTSDISMGLYPDGGTAVYFMPTPTPRTNNIVNFSPPVLPGQNDRTIAELTTLTVTNTATDTNNPGALLSYTLTVTNVLNGNVVTNAAISTNGIITWTPTEAQGPGTNLFTTVVSDGALTATNTFTVVVNEVNSAPVLPGQTNQTIDELTLLTVTNTATDADLPPNLLVYVLMVTNVLNGSVVTNAAISTNGIITWTPDQSQSPGTNLLTMVVTDNGLPPLSVTNSFYVIVREVNLAPVLGVIADQFAYELTRLTVTNAATEPNIHSITVGYGLIDSPVGADVDPGGVFAWTPAPDQSPATNLITTVVTNANPYDVVFPQLTATNRFTVVVVPLPRLQDLQINGSGFSFTLPSLAGRAYQLECASDLNDTNWMPVGAPVAGTGAFLTLTNDLQDFQQRFFRIRILP
ncbi:MAG TPA: lamin tail domain-containing protein, partial [Candidatus Acidoferrum sp.]|nr:lamin tail domain-containing protein [Candidatus Acidoferrum sp.]